MLPQIILEILQKRRQLSYCNMKNLRSRNKEAWRQNPCRKSFHLGYGDKGEMKQHSRFPFRDEGMGEMYNPWSEVQMSEILNP